MAAAASLLTNFTNKVVHWQQETTDTLITTYMPRKDIKSQTLSTNNMHAAQRENGMLTHLATKYLREHLQHSTRVISSPQRVTQRSATWVACK